MTEFSYKNNVQVEVLPVVDLCKKLAKWHFFVGGATQVMVDDMLALANLVCLFCCRALIGACLLCSSVQC